MLSHSWPYLFSFLVWATWDRTPVHRSGEVFGVLTALVIICLFSFLTLEENRQPYRLYQQPLDSSPFSHSAGLGQVQAPFLLDLFLFPATCCIPVPSSPVPCARCSQFCKWDYTFEPDEFGLVIGPVHSLQFGSDIWKVWWVWHYLWGNMDGLKTPERNFQDLRHSFFCGLPEKATLSWHESQGSFSNHSSRVVTRSWSLVQNHENQRDNLHWPWKKQLHTPIQGLWWRCPWR